MIGPLRSIPFPFSFHKNAPVIPCREAAGGSCHEEKEQQQVSLVGIDEWIARFPAVFPGDLFHYRFVDAGPFVRAERDLAQGTGHKAQDCTQQYKML
jgi:hypothetical protein